MTTTALQDATDPMPGVARNGWDRNRVRAVAYWATTLVIVFELRRADLTVRCAVLSNWEG